MSITPAESRELRELLGRFQGHLEASILGAVIAPIPEEEHACHILMLGGDTDKIDEPVIAQDRKDWRMAEEWVKRLEKFL